MKLSCSFKELKSALQSATKLPTKHASLPVLETVLFTAKNDQLVIRSTNLQVGLEISINAKVEMGGECAIRSDLWAGIISSVDATQTVELEITDGSLWVHSKGIDLQLETIPTEDFPTLPRVDEEDAYVLPIEGFIDGVKAVVYAASMSDIKPEIASVYLYQQEDNLVFVATDSFRLAEKKVHVQDVFDFPGVLIPVKNIQEVIKILAEQEGDMELRLTDSQMSILIGNIYMTLRVIDGAFPDYRQIMPTDFSTEALVLKSDLIKVLKLLSVFSDKFHQVELTLQPAEKKFTLFAEKGSVGKTTTSVDASVKGDDIETKINHRYLSDVFQAISDDSLQLLFAGERKPITLKGNTDKTFTYLIMPMQR